MDSLIFFLVVMLIIITNVVKAKKKLDKKGAASRKQPQQTPPQDQPQDENKAAGRWQGRIRDMFAEVQKEMARATQDREKTPRPAGRPSGWEDLVGGEKEAGEISVEAQPAPHEPRSSEPRQPTGIARGQTLIESRSRQGWTPEARVGVTERRQPAPALIEAEPEPDAGRRRFRYSREELRRAVIWYEVLGPPMSLRDPEREMWL